MVPDAFSTEDNSTEFNPLLMDSPTNTSDVTDVTATSSDSSESSSIESDETSETSEASDSGELKQMKIQDCVNGTQSCESSEEYFFQDIGDDGHVSVDHLMVPDDDDRELSLRR